MKKYLGFVAISVFLLYCTNTDRDNPNDMWGTNYIGKSSAEGLSSSVEAGEPSSSGIEEPSSSSAEPSSSSVEPSSSSEAESSSSVVYSSSSIEPSSSSAEPSSSSEVESSSSEESPPSSSSVVPSSSSALQSSSSEAESSSSVAPSSSSAEPSSSSAEPSSSSEAESSSSVAPSSSSVEPSSSSAEPSSSSVVPSSSSVVPSSSSAKPSSSSEAESSSSVAPSSSSNESCATFINGTKRSHYGIDKEQFCDVRDDKKYVYVKIGEQTWMAENLNYNAGGSMCYGGVDSNCKTYGRLYNWSTAMNFASSCNSQTCSSQMSNHKGICPSGWHIPSSEDWGKLSRYVDSTTGTFAGYVSSTAGKLLKAASGWNNDQESSDDGSTDQYGFSALLGGRYSLDGYLGVGDYGSWWSANEYNSVSAYSRTMSLGDGANWNIYGKSYLWSVRCLQDY